MYRGFWEFKRLIISDEEEEDENESALDGRGKEDTKLEKEAVKVRERRRNDSVTTKSCVPLLLLRMLIMHGPVVTIVVMGEWPTERGELARDNWISSFLLGGGCYVVVGSAVNG
jgi:hypothetical protein